MTAAVTILSPDASFAQRLAGSLDAGVRRVWDGWSDPELAASDALINEPDVVVVGPGFDGTGSQLAIVAALEARRPELAVIAVGPTSGTFALAAMRAGARDVIDPEGDEAELVVAVQRASELVDRRRSFLNDPDQGPTRHVITVLSPKGGTGKTTMSSNLAVGLARADVGPVVLVDFDVQFGDCCVALGLNPEHGVDDVLAAHALDATTLKMFLTRHPSGLMVLAPPSSLARADDLTSDDLKFLLGLLVDEFPWVVIDTAAGIDEAAIVAMEFATDLVFVGSTDVPAVRALQRQVKALDALAMNGAKRHLVLNRADARVGLSVEDIATTVGLAVSHRVPSSRHVPISTNQGTPVIESNSRDAVGKAFAQVVASFLPAHGGAPADKRRWRK